MSYKLFIYEDDNSYGKSWWVESWSKDKEYPLLNKIKEQWRKQYSESQSKVKQNSRKASQSRF